MARPARAYSPLVKSCDQRESVSPALAAAYESYRELEPHVQRALDKLLARLAERVKQQPGRVMFGPAYGLELLGALILHADACRALKNGEKVEGVNPENYHGVCARCQVIAFCARSDRTQSENQKARGNGNGKT